MHTVQERLQTTLNDSQKDKNGIMVSNLEGINFEIVDEAEPQSTVVVILVQRTDQDDTGVPILLTQCGMLSSLRQGRAWCKNGNSWYALDMFSVVVSLASRFIHSARSHEVVVTFNPSYAGRFEDTLELVFFDIPHHSYFVIQRKVCAISDLVDHERLVPKAPYSQWKCVTSS
ncbi:uncharacterized protein ARMOST_18400 [Armillaria ostoyae]|uniref:Uncharacterized protein n=1 Tax=Armillaria ostoyae TaxID=47428 RepID=A0A284S1R3_ARMOS|nr:uncharacterized protein ARMOST_18400 [Armillaria ostoyae]